MQFSEYLIDNSIITLDQFKQSVYSIVENRLMIGQLAYLKGYLSEFDVNQILLEQYDSNLRFGEICVANDLMTIQQIDELLNLQSQNHSILSEALLKEKILREKEVHNHLHHFKNHLVNESQVELEKTILKNVPILNSISENLRGFLFNEGYVTRFVSADTKMDPQSNSLSFASEIKLDRKSSCYLCLNLTRLITSNIAAVRQRSYSRMMDSSQYLDLFTEIMFCLNYKITQCLRKLGYKVKHGAAQACLPQYQRCVTLEYKTMLGPITIAIVS